MQEMCMHSNIDPKNEDIELGKEEGFHDGSEMKLTQDTEMKRLQRRRTMVAIG